MGRSQRLPPLVPGRFVGLKPLPAAPVPVGPGLPEGSGGRPRQVRGKRLFRHGGRGRVPWRTEDWDTRDWDEGPAAAGGVQMGCLLKAPGGGEPGEPQGPKPRPGQPRPLTSQTRAPSGRRDR